MCKLQNIINELSIDAILITNLYHLRYFTGFTGTTGIALVTKNGNYFYSDFRYKEQALKQVEPKGFQFVEVARDCLNTIADDIKQMGIKKLGFESKDISYDYYQNIHKLFQIELVALDQKLMETRQVKTLEEISIIKKAIEISEYAFSEVLKIIKPGMTEIEVAAYLEYMQRKMGAETTSFDTIIASGVRSAMPHGVASHKLLEKDEFITMDFGCYYNGYVSDMTRTIYLGNHINEKQKKIYDTVLNAQLLGVNSIKANMRACEIDKIVRDYITNQGFGKEFGHGLGHGIGLEIHELPYLSSKSDIILKENMIVTIEPGIYVENFCGVRIEDDVVITSTGCEILNKTSKELIIIPV